MANKKISQLAGTLPREIVSGEYLFPAAAGNASAGYETKKITAQEIAEFVFTGYGGAGFPATQLSGTKNVYLNNSNYIDSTAAQPPSYGFLMLRTSDGLLTTGSGIGTPVDGDNLGDHTATEALNMNNNDIINADDIRFYQSSQSIIAKGVGNDENLVVKAGNELTLKGNTHVLISGLGLDLASIPISGAVTFSGDITVTGANLEIDPGNRLIANEITITKSPGFSSGTLSIEGASYHLPNKAPDNGGDIFWDYSNIQYCVCDDEVDVDYEFNGVVNGQTLTLYVKNPEGTEMTPTFIHTDQVPVIWGAEYGNTAPAIAANKTNLYTFVRINTGIFASAVTGYVY